MKQSAQPVSFEKLAEDLSLPLLRYLRRLVGDQAVADDLLQETLIRIAQGLGSFSGRAAVKTWAFSIATHVATDYFRKPDRRHRIEDMSEAADLPDTGRGVDQRIIVDEMNTCVRQVIESLPPDYRAALVLHDLEDLTAEQTAEICGCSLATVKIRIHRARDRLRKALQQQCEFYRDPDSVLRCDRKR
ncbi:MAG: RNA polymerase sigma factor [Deltaproteobacteria bacterium]|nr:RNA polymerase sigma factor [Deltaproteobacteria bacterium]